LDQADIGIIGGSGVYDPEILENTKEVKVYTPYGAPSEMITLGDLKGKKVAFMPRHGRKHTIPPHSINFRANIWAMKELGVTRIISPSAVGSLRENIRPGEFVIPDQIIDFTKRRLSTFYDGGQVCHVSFADPFCRDLRSVVIESAKTIGVSLHENGTYVCIEGPRFSTRAESRLFRQWGADIIGMTVCPECNLAREAEICYVSVAMVTDYDVWAEKPVSAIEVAETMDRNIKTVRRLLSDAIQRVPEERTCECSRALKSALV
jgi:5'-methylthioadenosine phosphorylase